ncbi:MAG: hypothetical protein IH588_18645 [Anaerolineales bacterium]|nr:hypothetical protein [Anaerolineales bacterium]
MSTRYNTFIYISAGILFLFVARTLLAVRLPMPRLNDLFIALTVAGSLVVLLKGLGQIKISDWLIAMGAGLLVGVTMYYATLFTPYDFLGIVQGNIAQALTRGVCTCIAMLGGLTIMRQGGAVRVSLAQGDVWKTFASLFIGLAIGLPLAILNVFALQFTQGQSITWQNPLAALSDALQPALVEEIVYRFAFLGLVWLALQRSMPQSANWQAGLLVLFVHNFMHFDDLWFEAPFVALGMGLVMALVWGVPPTILALRRDLESAVAFHWIQDAARFLTGF